MDKFLYAFLCGFLPSTIWLFFWLREDKNHKEPRGFIASIFAGGAITVLIAIFIEKIIAVMYTDMQTQYILWAATEEILKFMVVGFIALTSRNNGEPVDAMIYCITAALGFAAIENTFFIMGAFDNGIVHGLIASNLRFIGASLVHTVSSALVGFGVGYTYYRGRLSKITATLIGLSAAIALHASFNLSIIDAQADSTLKAFAWIWGAVVLLIVLFEEVKAVRQPLI